MTVSPEAAFSAALDAHESSWGPPRRLLVGFSGGVDSTVLLHLCRRFDGERTVALHVNHGYADAAAAWQAHCRKVCAELGVPLVERELRPAGSGLNEAAARSGRYRLFAELLQDGDLLLLAHHADDQLETMVLHVLQGRGVFGMPAGRDLGRARLLRPLLDTPRAAIVDYARHLGLDWLDDPSNLDLSHDRNFLRARVLPLLTERFENLPGKLEQLSTRIHAEERLLAERFGLDAAVLDCALLVGRPVEEQAALLRLWLVRRAVRPTSASGLATFAAQLAAPRDRRVTLQLQSGRLERYRDAVHYVPEVAVKLERQRVCAPARVSLPQGLLEVNRAADGVQPVGELQLDFYDPRAGTGQAAQTIVLGGRRRAVRELLRGHGVPPWARRGYPLLRDDSGLLLVPGIAARDGAARGADGISARWTSAAAVAADR